MTDLSDQNVSRNAAFADSNALRHIALGHQFSQQFSDAARTTSTNLVDLVGEFGHAAVYSGVQAPAKGVAQLADVIIDTRLAEKLDILPPPEEAPFFSTRWHVQQAGNAFGIILPYMLTRSAMKSSGLSLGDKVQASILGRAGAGTVAKKVLVADAAATGFLCDFLTHPVTPADGNFWIARTKHGVSGALTMGSLTAASLGIAKLGGSYCNELTGLKRTAYDVTSGALSGIPAGLASADINAGLFQGRLATNQERMKSAYTMMFAGGTLSGLHRLEGQDNSVVQYAVGRYGDRAVKMVGGRGSEMSDSVPFNLPSPKDNFGLGTEFTRIELDVRGQKEPYYFRTRSGEVHYAYPDYKPQFGKGTFYLLAQGREGPTLVQDFEVVLDRPNKQSVQSAPEAGSKSIAASKAGGGPEGAQPGTDALAASSVQVGRISEGTIRIAREASEIQSPKVIPVPESAAASFDLGAHFSHIALTMGGKYAEYYRSKTQSKALGIEPNEFYLFAENGREGPKLVRDTEVFLVHNTGKEGMPTSPLSDTLPHQKRFDRVSYEAYRRSLPPENPSIEAMSTETRGRLKPRERDVDNFEPYVETFEPPRDFDPTRNSEDDAIAAMLHDPIDSEPHRIPLNFPDTTAIPDGPRGTKIVGTTSDGTNIRCKPGFGKSFKAESIPLTDTQVQALGTDSSEFTAVEVTVGESKVRLYQDKTFNVFYRLSKSSESGAKMERDFSFFEEPPVELCGSPSLRNGYFITRWNTPVDPVATKAAGAEIGEVNGAKVLRTSGLGDGLRPEVIVLAFRNPLNPPETPFEKVVLQIDGSPVDYYRLKSEPNRFYRWDPNSLKLTRDHSIYLKPR